MKNQDIITILHLSDIHFNLYEKDDINNHRKKIEDELIKNIKFHEKDGLIPNYIVVSGDIAFSANVNEYDEAERFLKRLMKETNIRSRKQIIIAPGNHDKVRNINEEKINNIIKKKNIKVSYEETINLLFEKRKINDEEIDSNLKQFENFNHFCKKFYSRSRPHDFTHEIYSFEEVIFVVVNSALFCTNSKLDKGRLFFDKNVISNLEVKVNRLKLNKKEPLIVTVMHHNPDWLDWNQKFGVDSTLKSIIEFSDILLTGHEHCAKTKPDLLGNECQLIYGGPSFDGDNYLWNNYSFLKFNLISNTFQIKKLLFNPLNDNKNKWVEISDFYLKFPLIKRKKMQIPFDKIELELLEEMIFKDNLRKKINQSFSK